MRSGHGVERVVGDSPCRYHSELQLCNNLEDAEAARRAHGMTGIDYNQGRQSIGGGLLPARHSQRPQQLLFPRIFLPLNPPAHEVGSLAVHTLHLPSTLLPEPLYDIATIHENGLLKPWGQTHSGILVPIDALAALRATEELRVGLLVTPKYLGAIDPDQLLSRVAWKMLSKCDAADLTEFCAVLAFSAENLEVLPAWQLRIAGLLSMPESSNALLLSSVREGRPLYYSKAIRWIMREIAAASHTGEWNDLRTSIPTSAEEMLGRGWFKTWSSPSSPAFGEILAAIWILHDEHNWEFTTENPSVSLARASFGTHDSRTTLGVARRWLHMWQCADDHPALNANVVPSELRRRYEAKVGTTPEDMIAGAMFVVIELAKSQGLENTMLGDQGAMEWEERFGHSALSEEVFASISRWLTIDYRDFARQCYEEAGDRYRGIGTLPSNDGLVSRVKPLVQFPDGNIFAPSSQLLIDQVTDLHRWRTDGGKEFTLDKDLATSFGSLYQAYIYDIVARLEGRYAVAYPKLLESIAEGKSCDFVLASRATGVFLFVEATVRLLPKGIVDGDTDTFDELMQVYQDKAEQIVETMKIAERVAHEIGGSPVSKGVGLIVVEKAILDNRFLATKMVDLVRNNIKVVGIDEFERLADLDPQWSIPDIVYDWTRHTHGLSLSVFLGELVQSSGPATPELSSGEAA